MTLTEQVAKNIIRKLLKGDDYRIEVVTLNYIKTMVLFGGHLIKNTLELNS